MVHRDLDESGASRLTLWILAVARVVWTVWFLVAGSIRESAPPLSSPRPAAYATAVSEHGDNGPMSLAEERARLARS